MKKKGFVLIYLISLISMPMIGQNTEKVFDIDLWPNGMSNTNGIDNTPFDESKQNYKPSMRVSLPKDEVKTGQVVVSCPGGSYFGLAYGHEGYEWAPFFNDQGITYITLKYRMPRGNRDVPFSDVLEAFRIVKENAEAWKIDITKIGIMGSSAGGHLASTVATHLEPCARPAFQILFYPVISMTDSLTHFDSRKNLLGADPTQELIDQYSNEKRVDSLSPRAFIVFSDDDDGVLSENGALYYLSLKKNKVPSSLHIYPSGGHGWGSLETFKFHNELKQDLAAWLKQL